MKYFTVFFTTSFLFLATSVFAQQLPEEQRDTTGMSNKIYDKLEVDASYPGGSAAWRQYLEKNLKAEVATDNGAPEGKYTVLVRFVVGKDGTVSDVKALSKNGYGTEQEVIRLIKGSGKWIPGIQNGRSVNSYHSQPVTFVVDDESIEITTQTPYVLFTSTENELVIYAYKVKPENLRVTISRGKIKPGADGKFIATVTDTTQRAIITVYNAKKNDQEIGAVSFEVKPGNASPDGNKQQ